jgi:hypothetical protein
MDLADPIGALGERILFNLDNAIVTVLDQELLNAEIDNYKKKRL